MQEHSRIAIGTHVAVLLFVNQKQAAVEQELPTNAEGTSFKDLQAGWGFSLGQNLEACLVSVGIYRQIDRVKPQLDFRARLAETVQVAGVAEENFVGLMAGSPYG